MHLYLEKSILTPISSPTIPPNPIFYSILNSPSNHSNFMVKSWIFNLLAKDSSSVFFKLSSGLHPTSNWPPRINFCFHVISPLHRAIFFSKIKREILHSFTFLSFISTWSWWIAGLANLSSRAKKVFWVGCCILLASIIRNSAYKSKFINSTRIATFTRSSGIAIDGYLRTD